ncbi:MAG: hypothetical protein IPL77_07375 [Flavobacteriales bacterium]|nr:hypothetical protein [Flavobacteriales bacterium]
MQTEVQVGEREPTSLVVNPTGGDGAVVNYHHGPGPRAAQRNQVSTTMVVEIEQTLPVGEEKAVAGETPHDSERKTRLAGIERPVQVGIGEPRVPDADQGTSPAQTMVLGV